MTKTPLRAVSLFAGIGGIDLGLHRLGARTVAYSEVEPFACSILAARFPDATNLGDITTIDWKAVNDEHGRIDIVAGGFPCQDLSIAGKRGGIHAGRSGLFFRMADAIRVLRPRIAIMENVAGLLTGPGWMAAVVGELAEIGYDVTWDCIPAAAVGAPHRRDRVYLIATPEGTRTTPPVWHRPPYLAARLAARDMWPTPAASNPNDGEGLETFEARRHALKDKHGNGNGVGTPLTIAAQRAEAGLPPMPDAAQVDAERGMWPTPNAARAGNDVNLRSAGGNAAGHAPNKLGWAVAERETFPTPTVDDANNVTRESGQFQSLTAAVTGSREQFPTPIATDHTSPTNSLARLMETGEKYATGDKRRDEEAPVERVAPLNPGFVEWLMGYPHGWTVASDPRAWWEWPAVELLNPDPWAFGEWLDVPRVLEGVPDRVARLRCLGNAVVPQVVGHVAEVVRRNYIGEQS